MKKWIFVSALFLMTSCTTMLQQGYDALQAGKTEEALGIFENLVVKENEPEAREGLRKAQQQWIERKLIDVRLFRLSENIGSSESLLKEIIQKQSQWQSFPTGAAYATQTEEIMLYSERVKARILKSLQLKNPLLAQFELNTHQFILNRALNENTSVLKNSVFKEAEEFCKREAKSIKPNDYFTQIWLVQTCRSWGISLTLKKTLSSVQFIKNLSAEFDIKNLDAKAADVLGQHLQKAFQKSKWFKNDGTYNLKAILKGDYRTQVNEYPVHRTAIYYVDVPYEETYKRVKDVKDRNNGGFVSLLGLLFSGAPSERVTDNNDGTETVYVTKYRKESRIFPYEAVEVRASKILDGEIRYSLDQQSLTFKVFENWNMKDDRHKENFRDAGLSANNPVIPSDEQWVSSLGDSLIQKLTDSLQQEWFNRFCQPLTTVKSGSFEYDEHIHRCGYQINGAIPEVINQYYLEKWKISFNDYNSLLVHGSAPNF